MTSKSQNIVQQLRDVAKAGDLLLTENGESDTDNESSAGEEDESVSEMQVAPLTPRESHVTVEETTGSNLVDARFSLRNSEVNRIFPKRSATRHTTEFGDMDIDRDATTALARTVNSIEQRSSRSRKLNERQRNEESDANFERASDYLHEDEMMLESQFDSESGAQENSQTEMDELATAADTFYENIKRKKQTKKSIRKAMYQVLPKFPSEEADVEGMYLCSAIARSIIGLFLTVCAVSM